MGCSMTAREHLYLFYLATTCWTLFFLGGLWSDYFQTWPAWAAFVFIDVIPAAVLALLSVPIIRWMTPASPYKGAFWIAFYFTIPFFIYDFVYLGLHKKLGLSFIASHWYLSIFYLIPWLATFAVVRAGLIRVPARNAS
jgi:hypothetical protein